MLNLFVFALPLLLFAIFLIKWGSNTTKPHNHLPPSPPRLPILGNLHQLGARPHRYLQKLAQHHGELMMLYFGIKPVLVVSSADAAREVMKTNDLIFSNRPRLPVFDKLFYGCKDVAVAPYGEHWRQMKAISVLHLLSVKRVRSFRGVREEELALLIENLNQSARLSLPVDLSDLFGSFSNALICRVAFGKKYSSGEGVRKLLGEFSALLGSFCVGYFIPWLSWVNRFSGADAKLDKVSKKFDTFLDAVVDEHMSSFSTKAESCGLEGEDKKDFVDVLLEVQKSKDDGSSNINRDSIKAVVLDTFVGGTDTTSTVLEWAMTELIRHPRVMKKLQDEVMGMADGKQDITENDLDRLPYLKAVIKETLRMYPPIPLLGTRESTQDAKIKGYDIAAKTMVIINGWALGRDPSLWDEPDEFQPERFMNSVVDFKGHDFQFIPFGAGRRGCPGIQFAMTTTEVVLANLVHKFDWALPDGAIAEDINMTECNGLLIHREVPLVALAAPRST